MRPFARLSRWLRKRPVFMERPALFHDWAEVRAVLVLAPHPDDDVIGCGGFLARLIQENPAAAVRVIYVTDGSACGTKGTRREVADLRRREAAEAARLLGLSPTCLAAWDEPDRGLAVTREIVSRLVEALRSVKPDLLLLPFPLDAHGDHAVTALIARQALDEVAEVAGARLEPACWCYETWTPVIPTILVDVTPVIEQKMAALAAHRSQCEIQDYPDKIRGLNRYRTMQAPAEVQYAEGFFVCSPGELAELVEGLQGSRS